MQTKNGALVTEEKALLEVDNLERSVVLDEF